MKSLAAKVTGLFLMCGVAAAYLTAPSDMLIQYCRSERTTKTTCYEMQNSKTPKNKHHKNVEDALNFSIEYSQTIMREAKKNRVPPELISSIIVNENKHRIRIDDWKDNIGLLLMRDVSVGPGQIKVSTAQNLAKGKTFDECASVLTTSEGNIHYIALLLSELSRGKDIFANPELLFDISARYAAGANYKNPPARRYACSLLQILSSQDIFSMFERPRTESERIKKLLLEYSAKQGC